MTTAPIDNLRRFHLWANMGDMDTLIFEAPEDAFITYIVPEGLVKSGSLLASLQSPKLTQQRSSLTALEEHLLFLERPFFDGRIDDEIAALAQKELLLTSAVKAQTIVRDQIQIKYDLGKVTADELELAEVSLFQAKNSQIDGHLASSHAQQKKTDMIDKIASAKNKIARDKTYLDAMDASLQINSTVAGTFYPNSFVGMFVRKGHNLGKINI